MLIARRHILATPLANATAAREAEFPPALAAAGGALVLNGTGARRYLGIEVYRAALYLERRATDAPAILGSTGVRLVILHCRRDVPLNAVERAWETAFAESCRCAVPGPPRAW